MHTKKTAFLVPLILSFILPTMVTATKPMESTAITIYNDNLALVRQTFPLMLEKGRHSYSYDGVASQIDPTSVHFKADGINVLEQNYEYDLFDNLTLMRKFVGSTIEVKYPETVIRGKLLSAKEPLIVETSDGRIRTLNLDEIISVDYPQVPEGLVLKPTLRWDLYSDKKTNTNAEMSYLTRGISWEASYVAVVSEKDDALEFSGWVQIDNNSGATYSDAKLKLMAGDVRIEREYRGRRDQKHVAYAMEEVDAGGFEEKSFFEYHLYTLPRPATIRDKQKKQITLFPSAESAAKKVLTYNPRFDDKKVEVAMEFENTEGNELGIPLPRGKVRLMKRDSDGSLEFIGEDRIDHTPKNEKVRLRTGKAFDIVVERVRKDQQGRSGEWQELEFEVEVRNSKEEDIEVIVVENLYRNWKILSENLPGNKKDAMTYEWKVQVPAEGKSMLKYRYRIWW